MYYLVICTHTHTHIPNPLNTNYTCFRKERNLKVLREILAKGERKTDRERRGGGVARAGNNLYDPSPRRNAGDRHPLSKAGARHRTEYGLWGGY